MRPGLICSSSSATPAEPRGSGVKMWYPRKSTFATMSATSSSRRLSLLSSDIACSDTHQSFEHEIIHELRLIEPRLEETGVSAREHHDGCVFSRLDDVAA